MTYDDELTAKRREAIWRQIVAQKREFRMGCGVPMHNGRPKRRDQVEFSAAMVGTLLILGVIGFMVGVILANL